MSITRNQHKPSLAQAYNKMTSRIRDSIENAEAYAIPTLTKAIEQAKDQAIHLGEVSLEEADEIGDYIKRDINESAEYLMETSHEFSEWLLLDINIIEQKVVELFLSVADKTQVELSQLSHPATYIGDIREEKKDISSTIITCEYCRQTMQKNSANQPPTCPYCGKTQ